MTSAFIVYIRPQLQPDPNEESADLLRVLLYKTDNTIFGGDVPEVPKWTGPPPEVVISLVFLYTSLAFSMTYVMFITLAKQLLYVYTLAGTSGSNAENGQDRQYRHGKIFRYAIYMLYSGLNSGFLCLYVALFTDMWQINRSIALIILCFTICILPIYTFCAIIQAFRHNPWRKMKCF